MLEQLCAMESWHLVCLMKDAQAEAEQYVTIPLLREVHLSCAVQEPWLTTLAGQHKLTFWLWTDLQIWPVTICPNGLSWQENQNLMRCRQSLRNSQLLEPQMDTGQRDMSKFINFLRHLWSSGYDVSLTRWRSPVRSWPGVMITMAIAMKICTVYLGALFPSILYFHIYDTTSHLRRHMQMQ